MMQEIVTKNGYDFFECSSAFQKSVRRGLEGEAMFWAVELYESNFVEYVWKRIRIISSEDVGLAEPAICQQIQSLYEMHKDLSKKKDDKHHPERLFLTHAVVLLCRAKKSRLIDWMTLNYFLCHDHELRDIPDFAYDKHTKKGRKMNRSWHHFLTEGIFLNNHQEQEGEEEEMEMAIKKLTQGCEKGLFDY